MNKRRLKKYIRSSWQEKAPDIWDKIEEEATQSMPKISKPYHAFRRSPLSLLAGVVLVIGVIAFFPVYNRFFGETASLAESTVAIVSTPVIPTEASSTTPFVKIETTDFEQASTFCSTTIAWSSRIIDASSETSASTTIAWSKNTADTAVTTATEAEPVPISSEILFTPYSDENGIYQLTYVHYVYSDTEIKDRYVLLSVSVESLSGTTLVIPSEYIINDLHLTGGCGILMNNSQSEIKKIIFESGIKRIEMYMDAEQNKIESISVPSDATIISSGVLNGNLNIFMGTYIKENKSY